MNWFQMILNNNRNLGGLYVDIICGLTSSSMKIIPNDTKDYKFLHKNH